jgi:hypothetical protein
VAAGWLNNPDLILLTSGYLHPLLGVVFSASEGLLKWASWSGRWRRIVRRAYFLVPPEQVLWRGLLSSSSSLPQTRSLSWRRYSPVQIFRGELHKSHASAVPCSDTFFLQQRRGLEPLIGNVCGSSTNHITQSELALIGNYFCAAMFLRKRTSCLISSAGIAGRWEYHSAYDGQQLQAGRAALNSHRREEKCGCNGERMVNWLAS